MRLFTLVFLAIFTLSTNGYADQSRLKRHRIKAHLEESLDLVKSRMQAKAAQHALKLAEIQEDGLYWTYLPIIESSLILAAIRFRAIKPVEGKWQLGKRTGALLLGAIPTTVMGSALALTTGQREAAQKALASVEETFDEQLDSLIRSGKNITSGDLDEFDEESLQRQTSKMIRQTIERAEGNQQALDVFERQLADVQVSKHYQDRWKLPWANKIAIGGSFLMMLTTKKRLPQVCSHILLAGAVVNDFWVGMTALEVEKLKEHVRYARTRSESELRYTAELLEFLGSEVSDEFVQNIVDSLESKNVEITRDKEGKYKISLGAQ